MTRRNEPTSQKNHYKFNYWGIPGLNIILALNYFQFVIIPILLWPLFLFSYILVPVNQIFRAIFVTLILSGISQLSSSSTAFLVSYHIFRRASQKIKIEFSLSSHKLCDVNGQYFRSRIMTAFFRLQKMQILSQNFHIFRTFILKRRSSESGYDSRFFFAYEG